MSKQELFNNLWEFMNNIVIGSVIFKELLIFPALLFFGETNNE